MWAGMHVSTSPDYSYHGYTVTSAISPKVQSIGYRALPGTRTCHFRCLLFIFLMRGFLNSPLSRITLYLRALKARIFLHRACRGNYEHAIRACTETALPRMTAADISVHAAWHAKHQTLLHNKTAAIRCMCYLGRMRGRELSCTSLPGSETFHDTMKSARE